MAALRTGPRPTAARRHSSLVAAGCRALASQAGAAQGGRSRPGLRAGLLLASSLTLLQTLPLRAAEAPFPPASTFRAIQLETLTCGRDNTSSSCEKARRLADPLLDHPRLSTACKDALWSVRQKAVTAPTNSFERRDPIDKASRDVTSYCRQPYVPAAASTNENPGGKAFTLRSFSP